MFLLAVTCHPLDPRGKKEKGKSRKGDGTYYDVGLGSCGIQNSDTEMVVALSKALMSEGAYCGKKVKLSTKKGTVVATVVDTCPGCDENSVDLSTAAFKKLGQLSTGRLKLDWSFL
ncbi:hypothetical protein DM01DRAFT_1337324 [Hesseltinella vesiculosa]|uniref:RlpA-like protein double-psi beta-barrel domain-containing protein n=1 Tax=Hesseltinella vesiculosa TaxID=101127 RepID=A0A1X2GDF2_9FUNG|nr:hypothetical protein DM01DRAFT_1337324 [Hesseltinella vesiculosa]